MLMILPLVKVFFCYLRECYKDWYSGNYKNQNHENRDGTVSPLKSWAKQVVLRDRNELSSSTIV